MVVPVSPPAVEAHHDAADGLKEDMRRLWTDHVVWTRATLVDLMKAHLTTTTNEVVARLNEVYRHILMMSDALSDGIVKQFPNTFGGGVTSTTGKNEIAIPDPYFAGAASRWLRSTASAS